MPKLRLVIADDEPLARERIRALLHDRPDYAIVAEAENGPAAAAAIEREHPDVVLLDVQMPSYGGLEVAQRLPRESPPAVIFVTAHERFAIEAFEAHAVDYLLKPFDRERLELALTRAAERLSARTSTTLGERVEQLIAAVKPKGPERIALRCDGRVVFVTTEEIVWAEAANNYCILHLADRRRLLIRESMTALEKRLGDDAFMRVNRSALVRLDRIQELRPATYGDHVVLLNDGTRLPLSRSLRGRLERFVPHGLK